MRGMVILVAICCSVSAIALWFWANASVAEKRAALHVRQLPPDANARRDEESGAAIGALNEEMQRLRAEIGLTNARVVDSNARLAALAPKEEKAVAKDSEEDDTPRTKEASEEARHLQLADLQAQFAAEPVDAGWARTAVSTIRDSADKAGIALSRIREIDCRSQGCRVEVLDDSSSARQAGQALMPFLRESGGMFPRVTADHYTRPDQQSSYVLYMGPL